MWILPIVLILALIAIQIAVVAYFTFADAREENEFWRDYRRARSNLTAGARSIQESDWPDWKKQIWLDRVFAEMQSMTPPPGDQQ